MSESATVRLSGARRSLIIGIVLTTLGSVMSVPALATTQSFSGSLSAAGPSFKWHPFNVTELGTISATLNWDNASADFNLFLQNPAQIQVAQATSATRKPETVSYEAD